MLKKMIIPIHSFRMSRENTMSKNENITNLCINDIISKQYPIGQTMIMWIKKRETIIQQVGIMTKDGVI